MLAMTAMAASRTATTARPRRRGAGVLGRGPAIVRPGLGPRFEGWRRPRRSYERDRAGGNGFLLPGPHRPVDRERARYLALVAVVCAVVAGVAVLFFYFVGGVT